MVVDLVAGPGMGKSRLLHEFRRRIGKERASVLTGSCSPDGQETPFFPFLEVVRGSFRISTSDAENDIAQKLTIGLTALGLHSVRNVGLLLHLLGLKVTDDALIGLDGLADRAPHPRASAGFAGDALPTFIGCIDDRGSALG